MKKMTLIVAFGLLFNLLMAQNQNIKFNNEFDKLLAQQFKPNEPGAAALVARKGQVIYKKGFGMANMELNVPMQPGNVFRIGSITKQITAIAILQLMEQGKLSLQDEITRFIADYPTQGNKITIEHLLTHTSGIQDFTSIRDTARRGTVDFSPVEMIDYFKNRPMRFAPGTRWEYNNSGYFLLGYIIEKVTGRTYRQYIEEQIFKPLEMTSSLYASEARIVRNRADGYTKTNRGFENAPYLSLTQPYAAGSVQSSPEDLFKWQQAVNSYKLVKKETLEKAFTRYKLNNGQETNYGYGWRLGYIQGSPSIWHGGLINGFFSMAMYLPQEDVYVVVLANCDCNSPADVAAKLAALAINKPYTTTAIPVDNATLAAYAGVYENGKGQQRTISVSDNQLYSQIGRGPRSLIKAWQKDNFFVAEDEMQTVEFSRNSKGQVEKLITKSRIAVETWNKTDKPVPNPDGIKVDEKILDKYIGTYEVMPDFTIEVTREQNRIFVQATKQEKLEIFAETETKFFLKVVDAQVEFVTDATGKASKLILTQNGRSTEAKRIK
jgi:CubicO group peptidase (beta-lactamase class C family)